MTHYMEFELKPFRDAGFEVSCDLPDTPMGVGWIDLKINGATVSLSYQAGNGFGIYYEDPEEICYGQKPDEIVLDAVSAVKRIQELLAADYDWHPHEG